jgi:hypothetical protein
LKKSNSLINKKFRRKKYMKIDYKYYRTQFDTFIKKLVRNDIEEEYLNTSALQLIQNKLGWVPGISMDPKAMFKVTHSCTEDTHNCACIQLTQTLNNAKSIIYIRYSYNHCTAEVITEDEFINECNWDDYEWQYYEDGDEEGCKHFFDKTFMFAPEVEFALEQVDKLPVEPEPEPENDDVPGDGDIAYGAPSYRYVQNPYDL